MPLAANTLLKPYMDQASPRDQQLSGLRPCWVLWRKTCPVAGSKMPSWAVEPSARTSRSRVVRQWATATRRSSLSPVWLAA